jgi:hypothetical protein
MLKRVLAANSSWCREGPRINLGHGLARTNESRAWPGVAILIRRGGQRPWDLGRLRVERRANGDASSVMQRVPRGPVSSLAARQIKLGLEPASEAVELAVSWPTVM